MAAERRFGDVDTAEETAMGRRITRAKAKIKAARIPYQVPSAEDLPARFSGVLALHDAADSG
jgi:predicted RNA polymerase sigma factor